jgi:hypothetical protein
MQKFNAWPLATALLILSPMASSQTLYGVTEIGEPDITSQLVAMQPVVQRPFDMSRSKSVAMSASGVVEIGEPDMDVPLVKQSGSNKTLPEALRAILPKDWHAKKNASVDRAQRISWNKGSDWLTILNEVAIAYRLSLSVDWDTRTVTVLKQDPAPLKPATFANEDLKPTNVANVFTVNEEKWNEIKPKHESIKEPLNKPLSTIKSVPVIKAEDKNKITPTTSFFIKGPLKEAAEQVANKWHNKIDWAIDETQGKFVLGYEVLIAGKTLEDDLQTLGDAASNDQLRLKFDLYANNVVKISQSGDE